MQAERVCHLNSCYPIINLLWTFGSGFFGTKEKVLRIGSGTSVLWGATYYSREAERTVIPRSTKDILLYICEVSNA